MSNLEPAAAPTAVLAVVPAGDAADDSEDFTEEEYEESDSDSDEDDNEDAAAGAVGGEAGFTADDSGDDMDNYSDDDGPLPPPRKVARGPAVEEVYRAACRVSMSNGRVPDDQTRQLLSPPRIDAADRLGTAITEAIQLQNYDTLEVLIQFKANVDHQLQDGTSALMEAARKAQPRSVQILLAAGAKTDFRDRSQTTALMLAASMGAASVVHALVKAGADVNLQNSDRDSALMIAAYNNARGCVQALLKHPGIDLELKDKKGRTALLLAARFADKEVIDLLTQAGARGGEAFEALLAERDN